MKLCIKQKVFTIKDTFSVTDENGSPVCNVTGKVFSWGKQLTITDMTGSELGTLKQKVMSFLPTYVISQNGEEVAKIVKKISFMRPKFDMEGPNWHIEGNFIKWDYDITADGQPIASINKKYFSWGDTYVIDIPDERNSFLVLAVVLAIDAALHDGNN